MCRVAISITCLTAILACYTGDDGPKASLSQTQAAQAAASSAGDQGSAPSGLIVEQLSAPPYTYLRIKTSAGEVWAAVSETAPKNGSTVTLHNAMLMENFESKTLKRKFEKVWFGTLSADVGGGGTAASGGDGAAPKIGTPPVVSANVGKVEKASGADARTVAELWAQASSLVGKTVTIRGVVVKYNGGVMGKNWIHLQDGSGDATRGDNDITVTTTDEASMGATIVITGTVHTKRDFGAGYTYAVIVENARVAKQM